ncbi:glycosyltransferase WbuB [Caballeronia novacaledonica]|uniref:WcaI family glycosyltransferase n=1 Tax=Caballeronia novacaledonica TaxID=1544861 RepID=UPI001EE1A647|nr:WcaI family glycosyltransferase [Caballeronia novacaledonica]GJH13514.1 glycosyltransferase WbuB [Caballeronia novacaledonica]
MKVLMISLNYAPEMTGVGKYSAELAEWLALRGHTIRVITASPYYPEWRVRPGYNPRTYTTERINNVSVTRVPFWCPKQPSGLRRVLHLMSFALFAFPAAMWQIAWRPQAVWLVEPPLFASPSALLAARIAGASFWLHVQDYEVDAAFRLGILKGRVARKLALCLEKWLMSRADVVSAPSVAMTRLAVQKGVPREKTYTFTNWVEIQHAHSNSADSAYRAQLAIGRGVHVVLYSGNLGLKQGLEIIADVAKLLMWRTDILFVICGAGPAKSLLHERTHGLPNIKFLDLQPKERFDELLALADMHVLPQRADAADIVMPSKLGAMLSSNRPVIATASRGTELWDVVNSVGLAVEPESPTALSQAVLRLADDCRLREHLGALGRQYAASNLSKDSILLQFEARLRSSVTGRQGVGDEATMT